MKQVPKRDPETATEAVHRIWGDPYEAHKPRHNCPHCRCAGADPQRLTVNQLQTRDLLVELWPWGVDRALVEVGRYLDALKACASTSGDTAAELGVERPPDCPEWLWRMPVCAAMFCAMDVQFKLKNYKVQVDLEKGWATRYRQGEGRFP